MKDPHPQLLRGFRRFKLRSWRLNGGLVVYQSRKRYPRVGTVSMYRGFLASSPSASRSSRMYPRKQFITYAGVGPEAVEQFPFGHQPLSILHKVEQNLECLGS